MIDKKAEEGAIQLDNQGIQVRILMPSGRFQITDKVTGTVWSMKAGNSSGSITLENNDREREYRFGSTAKQGVAFTENYYMMRSADREDFHDVSLTGVLGDDSETRITIRYLLSTAFPVLNCYCYVSGNQEDRVKKIQFPLGFRIPDGEQNHIWLPQDINDLQSEDLNGQNPLWQPDTGQNHRVAGSPFFILTRNDLKDKASGCIGYLQHPLSLLDINRGKTGRFVTPLSSRLDVTGKKEENPYYFRYQFVPSDDPEALSWLYKEYLLEQDIQLNL